MDNRRHVVDIQNRFERYELKYLMDVGQYEAVRRAMDGRTVGDEYGRSTVCNIYYDTPDMLLIRRSLEKPIYKEKLRLRSYGTARDDSRVFLELKKKYRSVVYKRRAAMRLCEAEAFFTGPALDTQIKRELAYFIAKMSPLVPAMLISCEREAYFGADDRDLRITFDRNILWRDSEMDLRLGAGGRAVLAGDAVLMEIKVAGAVPLWLSGALASARIYPTSFSKYGRAYCIRMAEQRGAGANVNTNVSANFGARSHIG